MEKRPYTMLLPTDFKRRHLELELYNLKSGTKTPPLSQIATDGIDSELRLYEEEAGIIQEKTG